MTKVKQKYARQGAAGASTRAAQVARQKKHRITVAGGDPNEKKLPTVVTFHSNPPPGYTFIPAGNPELTAALKEFARRGDHKIYAVTTTNHFGRHELSKEIHRVGFHFPTTVVDQVCAHYGIRLTDKGKLIDESQDDGYFARVYQTINGQRPLEEPAEEKDQVTINTDAKQTIKDLFPNIPINDLYKIIKTAFQLGDHKVGTAPELDPIRRAQLAVVAHIRHNYTSYDRFLRQMPYNEARHAVERDTLTKLLEWRGDEDTTVEDKRAANDVLKEVIVISDEGESESDADNAQPLIQEHIRVEELPSTTYGAGRDRSPVVEVRREHFQQHPRVVQTYRPSDAEIVQWNQSRHAVWDQARRDFHSKNTQNSATVTKRVYEPENAPASRILIPVDSPSRPQVQPFYTDAPESRMRVDYEPLPPSQPTPPMYIRDANGNLFERVEARPHQASYGTAQRYQQTEAPAMSGALFTTRPSSPQQLGQQGPRYRGTFGGGDGIILPSIEGPDGSYAPPRSRQNPLDRQPESREINARQQDERSRKDVAYIDLTNSQTPKRRRLEEVASQPEQRVYRERSPLRATEYQYAAQTHPRDARLELRRVEYGEPRPIPRLQHADPLQEDASTNRQPVYDSRDVSRPVPRVYEPLPGTRQLHEPPSMQPRYHTENYAAVSQNVPGPTLPVRDQRDQVPFRASRVYEPIVESRMYDSSINREQDVPIREKYVQAPTQEARVRYISADKLHVRENLQHLLPQRVVEYDLPSAAPLRSYAR